MPSWRGQLFSPGGTLALTLGVLVVELEERRKRDLELHLLLGSPVSVPRDRYDAPKLLRALPSPGRRVVSLPTLSIEKCIHI